MTQLRLLAATVVLSLIVWVYADQASQGSYTTIVRLRLIAPADPEAIPVVESATAADSTEPGILRARLTLVGPKAAIQRFTASERGGTVEIKIPLPDGWTDGRHRLDLMEALARCSDLIERGLRATSAAPPAADLLIDRMTSVTFTVEPDLGRQARSIQSVLVTPKTVRGRLRRSQLPAIGGADNPVVVLPVQDLLRDARESVGPVVLPLPSVVKEVPVEFDPREVEFTATVSNRTVSKKLDRVAVSVLPRNADMLGQFEVKWADSGDRFQTVIVQVPADRAEGLKPEDVTAFVVFASEDAVTEVPTATTPSTGGWITRTVQFAFPPGYEDVRVEGTPPAVRIKVVKAAGVTPAVAPEPAIK